MQPYPTKIVDGGYNNIEGVVTETADYIARVDGPRTFPWRILVIGDDKVVASSNLSYLLAGAVAHRRHLMDQTRQGGMGLVEQLEYYRS